jgi:pimeloyl-ACP methyl ester carboxylesterase
MNGNDRLRRVRGIAASVACVSMLAMTGVSAEVQPPQLETKSYTIPSGDPGIDLFIRNKHQAGVQQYGPNRILLFVHGATYPAETAFDLPIEGASMMDLFAQHGYDVYLVDVRGYGGSTGRRR